MQRRFIISHRLFVSLVFVGQLTLMAGAGGSTKSVEFIAHRGGVVSGYPENTLATFRRAIEQGVDAIEIDLRGTKDGQIVIMHDETVDRTTDGTGKVADLTLAELRALDAGRGERIPTYEEVLRLVEDTGVTLLLDIKPNPALDKVQVVRQTEEHNALRRVIVGPRTLEDLLTLRALNPDLRVLGFIRTPSDSEAFLKAGADIIRLWLGWVYANPERITEIQRSGKLVWTTAGDASRKEMERLIEFGVDGIILDRPELVQVIRNESGNRVTGNGVSDSNH